MSVIFKGTLDQNGKRIPNPSIIEKEKTHLEEIASEISAAFQGKPPVLIIVGGIGTKKNDKEPVRVICDGYCITRYRDRVGLLQTAIDRNFFEKFPNRLKRRLRWLEMRTKIKDKNMAQFWTQT